MGVVSAERWMMGQLIHSGLKLIQVTIRLISPPCFAGIDPDSGEVRFRLRRDRYPEH